MLPSTVRIREVGPRDGFQSIADFIATDIKVEIIAAIADAGVRHIEATAFVNPQAIPNLKDAGDVMARVPRDKAAYAALVPNLMGAENAMDAGVDELVVVISASEAHNRANVRRRIDESVADLDAIFEGASRKNTAVSGAIAVAFGCPYMGNVPEPDVFRLVDAYVSRGAAQVILADTTGMAIPRHVDRMVRRFNDRYPDTALSLHFHNNRGTAMVNLYTALTAGARIFDTALGGIGGCPNVPQAAGNLPTEDVVYLLEALGIDTGVRLDAIIAAAAELEKYLGYTLPGQVMKSGPREKCVLTADARR